MTRALRRLSWNIPSQKRYSVCMRMSGSLHCVLYGGWLVVLVTGGLANSSLSDESTEAHPVVVELFESQGCSSCPPAEAVLEFLAREFNQTIIPLSFHVDYWDQLGWKDPFSDPRFTERQGSYANAFHQDSMYTPEMVVQGDVGFNGADEKRARQEITSHQSAPGSRFSLHVTRSVARRIKFEAQWPAGLPQQPQAMTAVLYETAEPVHVLRGENAGATMGGD